MLGPRMTFAKSWVPVALAIGATLGSAACDDSTGPDTSRNIASVVVTPDTRSFTAINDSARLSAEARNPVGGTISGITFTWSSLESSIASVDQTGMVKARAVGTARIVATASGRSDTATITVAQTAAHLVLTPEADTINAIGDVVTFTAVVTDANNVPLTNPTITWSTTTPSVVSVVGGNVTSTAVGSGAVIATSGSAADTAVVLSRQIAATLTVTPSPVAVMVGETQQLTAAAADSNGVALPASAVTWTSASQAIATVSTSGLVRGESAGATTVTAAAPGRSMDVPVTVQPGAPTGPLSWSVAHRGLVFDSNEPLGILGSGPSDVFVVGRTGPIYRFDGTRWTNLGAQGIPASTQLRGFWGTSSGSIWAAGTDTRPDPNTGGPIRSGRVFRATGTTWTIQHTGQDFATDFWDVSGTSDTDVWVAGTQIIHYDGATWTPSLVPADLSVFTAIWAANPTSVFAGTNAGGLWRHDGSNWQQESTDNGFKVTDIWGTSPTDVWAVDEGGFVRHWNGSAWTQSTRFGAALHGVRGTSATNVWVGGAGILAQWNGGGWFSLDPATTAIGSIRGIWLSAATSGWFVTTQGVLSELRPEGWTTHWDSPGIFTDVAGSASDAWVCGHRGTIQHLNGGTWRTERLPRSDACGSVTARSTTDVLAGGVSLLFGTPSIYYRFNGSTWTVNPTGAAQSFEDMWTTPDGQSYAVDGTATVYRFDGAGWVEMPTGSPQRLHSIWASGPNDVFAAGELGTVMHYDGASWTKLATGTTGALQAVWGASSTNVFFVGSDLNGGLVLRYNGTSFSAANPTSRGLTSVHGRSPNEVYAVGAGGTIIRFNGSAWSAEASGVDTDLYDVWALVSGEVYAVGVPSLIVRGTR
jgi:hypothetical protein